MPTDYPGIDYSLGLPMENGRIPNRDEKTAIRYGVIPVGSVVQAWCDSSEADYACEECEEKDPETDECVGACEPVAWVLDDGEYEAVQSCGDPDIFIIKSPYYTYAQFCSPCAPGACYLLNPIDEKHKDNKCYCFGEDWFDGPCPYPIWKVKEEEDETPETDHRRHVR